METVARVQFGPKFRLDTPWQDSNSPASGGGCGSGMWTLSEENTNTTEGESISLSLSVSLSLPLPQNCAPQALLLVCRAAGREWGVGILLFVRSLRRQVSEGCTHPHLCSIHSPPISVISQPLFSHSLQFFLFGVALVNKVAAPCFSQSCFETLQLIIPRLHFSLLVWTDSQIHRFTAEEQLHQT